MKPRPPSVKVRRKKLSRTERYAAVIMQLTDGNGESVIDREWAKTATPEQIVEAFEKPRQWDHAFPKALGGTEHPTNMQPLLKERHAVKTKRDRKLISKAKRITPAQEEFRRKMLAKVGMAEPEEPKTKKGYVPIPGSKKSKWKRNMSPGKPKWERRP